MNDEKIRLNIGLMGAPEIRIAPGNSAVLPLNHIKARALLFYLSATGQTHTRNHLATLLWSEAGSTEAHHSLRTSLYHLRQALQASGAGAALIGEGDLLGLKPDAYECDVIELRRLLLEGSESSLARAVTLYRGSFLQGFTLADAPVFEDWVQLEQTQLSQSCLDALDSLSTAAESRHEWGAALGYTQQMILIDPLDEAAQQRLIRLHLQSGETGQALRQYRQFENQLREELGLAPSAETRALLAEVLRQQQGTSTLSAVAVRPSRLPPHSLPFIGRDPLLDQLSALSQEVQAGSGTTVLLQGEGGIGKSRVLDELASRLAAGPNPWILLQGACSPFDDLLTHGAFLEALQNGFQADLTELLAESNTSVPDARGRFFWNVLQTVRSLSQTAPLLLAIDDLQWANSSTLNLFGFLAMRLHHLPIMLIGTVQQAETIPALQRLVTLGRRRGELHLFPLTPLTPEAVLELLHTYGLDPASAEALAEWLHLKSAGNPFLLTEILAQLRTEVILKPTRDAWQLDATRWLRWRSTFMLPETAHDLVSWRLANISLDARGLLDVLAVAGRPLPVAVLRRVPGIRAAALPGLVDELVTRGLIIEPPEARLALPHHLLRETLLQHLSDLRRRTIHQHLAEVLDDGTTGDDEDTLREIALHAVTGEDVDRARRFGLRVLADLPQEYTGAETVDFVHHLYDLLVPTASLDEMVRLTSALGMLHQSLGHPEVAAHWHAQNLEWAKKTGNPAAQAEAHFEMGELALISNNYQVAAESAQAGLDLMGADEPASDPSSPQFQPLVGRGHRLLGAALAMEGSDLAAAEEHLRAAAFEHRRTGNQGDLCAALFELGNIAAQRGELGRALDLYEEAAHTAEGGRIHYYFALARNNFAYHSLLLGQIDAARQSAAQGLKVAEAYDLLAALLHLYSTQGEIHLYLGEWDLAEESFRRGLALAEELGSLERQAGYRGGLALVARGRRDPDAAVQLLEEALTLITEQGYWHLRTRLQLWLAQVQFEKGCFAEATAPLEEALLIAREQHRALLLVQGERLRASLLAANGDWPAADALFAEAFGSASALGLPLELAGVQAAWGRAALQHSPVSEQGRALMVSARATLAAHKAQADLAILLEGESPSDS
jgi:DNA-binding SARP family transcriptional activator/tetratricopeptide (TPR) repeat protein